MTSTTGAALGASCLTAGVNDGFVGGDFASQSAPFTLEVDLTPGSDGADALFGLSANPAGTYSHLAAIARFDTDGYIDARNGGAYGVKSMPYRAGIARRLRFEVDPSKGRYSVRPLMPASPGSVADDYAFRTEQAGSTTLAHFALKTDDGGPLSACNVVVNAPCVNVEPDAGFANRAFPAQTVAFSASVGVTPAAAGIDTVVGFTNGAASRFNDIAAAIRFNPNGTIDARNGGNYSAERTVTYAAGTPVQILFVVDVLGHQYSAYANSNLIANQYAFRSEQAEQAILDNLTVVADSGPGGAAACDFGYAQSEQVAWLHPLSARGLSLNGSRAPLPNGELLAAEGDYTDRLDASGAIVASFPHGGVVKTDAAGNRYLFGSYTTRFAGDRYTVLSAGGVDTYVAKYDSAWSNVSTQSFGGVGDDPFGDATVNASGETLLAAGSRSYRLDAGGAVLWTLDASSGPFTLDDAGGAYFGTTTSQHDGISVSKRDAAGNVIWTSVGTLLDGGAELQYLAADPTGGVVLAGSLNGSLQFAGAAPITARPPDRNETFVAKIAEDGHFVRGTVVDVNLNHGLAVDGLGRASVAGVRYNPDRFFLERIDLAGTGGVRELGGQQLSNGFVAGSAGAPVADAAGNVYFGFSERLAEDGGDWLVRILP